MWVAMRSRSMRMGQPGAPVAAQLLSQTKPATRLGMVCIGGIVAPKFGDRMQNDEAHAAGATIVRAKKVGRFRSPARKGRVII